MTTHIISEHFGSPRWIPLQARQFERHGRGSYRTYTCLEGADPSYAKYFTRVVRAQGPHAGKLNHLAEVVIEESTADEDLVVFLDGDAFPISSLLDRLDGWLSEAPLVAVRRDENLGDPQPHPCFCVTTVGFWRELRGDWSEGYAWPARDGTLRTDVGANLVYSLTSANVSWKPLLRTNHMTFIRCSSAFTAMSSTTTGPVSDEA